MLAGAAGDAGCWLDWPLVARQHGTGKTSGSDCVEILEYKQLRSLDQCHVGPSLCA